MPLLVDTGIIYALADRRDAWHRRARRYLESSHETLLAPATILTEVAYLLRSHLGPLAERTFVVSLADGELGVEDLRTQDWRRAQELMVKYEALGFVDATIVAVAERLRIETLATTDRRHFSGVQPAHVQRLTLVP
jgi:predicted nucleic acid-binding protein